MKLSGLEATKQWELHHLSNSEDRDVGTSEFLCPLSSTHGFQHLSVLCKYPPSVLHDLQCLEMRKIRIFCFLKLHEYLLLGKRGDKLVVVIEEIYCSSRVNRQETLCSSS